MKKMPPRGRPRLRFAGFEGEWVFCLLSDCADIVGGGTPDTTNSDFWNGNIDWYSPSEIGEQIFVCGSAKKITRQGLYSCSATILPADITILFTSRASIGLAAILKREGATNQGFQSLVVRQGCDTYFLYSQTPQIRRYAEQRAAGSTFLEISGKLLGQCTLSAPSLQEQRKVGRMFRQLDRLIILHRCKLEKLQRFKEALLAGMFVNP